MIGIVWKDVGPELDTARHVRGRRPRDLDGALIGEATFALPADLPLGYHRVHLRSGERETSTALIVTPLLLDRVDGLAASANLALVGGIAALLYRRLKHWTKRPRPCAADPRIHAWIAPLDEYSFPSGHTLHAVSFGLVACAWYPWASWFFVPFTAAIALSRVVLGMHYPSDVLAAATIGGVLATGSIALF